MPVLCKVPVLINVETKDLESVHIAINSELPLLMKNTTSESSFMINEKLCLLLSSNFLMLFTFINIGTYICMEAPLSSFFTNFVKSTEKQRTCVFSPK